MDEMEKHYSDDKFWEKLKKFALRAGHSVVYTALLLYYVLQKPDLPAKARVTILAALGYFIFPVDLIPDLAVGIGFTDDLGALGVALFQVAIHIDDNVKAKAKAKLVDWFGEDVDTSEVDEKL
ncbi:MULTISPECIES: YkvA family protein [unclassified Fredinandcohnia]|uniref:YkvA family protein n=1 Tax=unclassified Fredinandcohnia TaxID=2837514 RepID=UPI0030FD9DC6